EPDRVRVVLQRATVGFRCAREVVLLLRKAEQGSSGASERVGAGAVAVAELCRLAIALLVAEALRLFQRVRSAVDVFEAVDERAHQTEKRIRPVGAQFGSLAKGGD